MAWAGGLLVHCLHAGWLVVFWIAWLLFGVVASVCCVFALLIALMTVFCRWPLLPCCPRRQHHRLLLMFAAPAATLLPLLLISVTILPTHHFPPLLPLPMSPSLLFHPQTLHPLFPQIPLSLFLSYCTIGMVSLRHLVRFWPCTAKVLNSVILKCM